MTIGHSIGRHLIKAIGSRFDNLKVTIVDQGGNEPGHRQEHYIPTRSGRPFPTDLTGLRIETEQSPAVVMRKAKEELAIHYRRTHIESHALLAPLTFDVPLSILQSWPDAVYASVFTTQQNPSVVKGRSRHILIGTDVRKRILPQELSRSAFHTD